MKKQYQRIMLLSALLLIINNVNAQTKEITLKEALQLASRGNRNLQIQVLQNQKMEEVVKEAKSFLLPTVTLNTMYSVYGERPVIYLRNETGPRKVNDIRYGGRFVFDGTITASYPILNHVSKSNIRMAGFSQEIQKQETKYTEEQLALDITQLYLTVLVSKERKSLLEQSLHRNQRALKDSRSLFLQGKNLKTDTLSNYISVQNLAAAISALNNNINVLSVQLKQLMGIENNVQLEFTDSLSIPVEEAMFQITGSGLGIAIDNRKDLKIQSLMLDQRKEQLTGTKAEFKPQLSVVAQYQVQTQEDNLQFWNYGFPRTAFAGIRLNIPIYSGGRLKYRTSQSQIEIKKNELAVTELKNKIQTELISLSANLQEAYNQWKIQEENVKAAEINYRMMNDRYRNGLGNRLELTDAELALTKAKLDSLQTVYSVRLIEAEMKKAMGILHLPKD
jgi:outer membrane protein